MSFSFEYFARTKEAAIKYLDDATKVTAPALIKDVIRQAITGVRDESLAPHQQGIYVFAQGHLCVDGPGGGNYEYSQVDIKVFPKKFAQEAE